MHQFDAYSTIIRRAKIRRILIVVPIICTIGFIISVFPPIISLQTTDSWGLTNSCITNCRYIDCRIMPSPCPPGLKVCYNVGSLVISDGTICQLYGYAEITWQNYTTAANVLHNVNNPDDICHDRMTNHTHQCWVTSKGYVYSLNTRNRVINYSKPTHFFAIFVIFVTALICVLYIINVVFSQWNIEETNVCVI